MTFYESTIFFLPNPTTILRLNFINKSEVKNSISYHPSPLTLYSIFVVLVFIFAASVHLLI
jgi:hypothetical protein